MKKFKNKLSKFALPVIFFGCIGFTIHISNRELDELIRLDELYSKFCGKCETQDEKAKCDLANEMLIESQQSMSSVTELAKWYGIAFMFVAAILVPFEFKSRNDANGKDGD